jgi:hypothetical protein
MEDFLEPQLVDLVNNDEQQLVMGGRLRPLKLEQLGDGEIASVAEAVPFLSEAGVLGVSRRTR